MAKSINDRLVTKAQERLSADLSTIERGLRDELERLSNAHSVLDKCAATIDRSGTQKFSANALIAGLMTSVYDALIEEYVQAEIDGFIAKVDGL